MYLKLKTLCRTSRCWAVKPSLDTCDVAPHYPGEASNKRVVDRTGSTVAVSQITADSRARAPIGGEFC